jgi:hypothetical protein
MSTAPDPAASENLVQVHHAHDEWEGNIIITFLRNNGVEATLKEPASVPPLDIVEQSDKVFGVFVLEHEAEKARALVREFQAAATDERVLEEEAAHKLKLDKETIHRLRGELREEQRTFELLGWLFVGFLAAAALLWAIWPSWLKINPPDPTVRWVIAIILALSAVLVGDWSAKRMK